MIIPAATAAWPAQSAPTTKGNVHSTILTAMATSRLRSTTMLESTWKKGKFALRPNKKALPSSPRRKGSKLFKR